MKKILIIDDDPLYRKVMGEILQQHGWEVLDAGEGEAGLELAKKYHPAVVLCDLLMPRSNGFQVCRALRSDPSLRLIRIIITSGRQFESDRQAAFAAGADQYLFKPIEIAELLKALSPAEDLRAGKSASEAPLPTPVPGTKVKFWGVRGSIPTPGPGTVRYLSSTVGSEAWNSRDLKSRPH